MITESKTFGYFVTRYTQFVTKKTPGESGHHYTRTACIGKCDAQVNVAFSRGEGNSAKTWHVTKVVWTHSHVIADQPCQLRHKLTDAEGKAAYTQCNAGVGASAFVRLLQEQHDEFIPHHAFYNAFKKYKDQHKGGRSDAEVLYEALNSPDGGYLSKVQCSPPRTDIFVFFR